MKLFTSGIRLVVVVALLAYSVVSYAVTPTIDSIIRDFERIEEKLFVLNDKFYVQYASVVAEKRLLKSGEKNLYLPVRYINARKGEIWVVRSILVNDDPEAPGLKNEMTFYSNKGNVLDWKGTPNHAVVAPFELGRNSYHNWYLFQYYGVVPFRYIAESNGVSYKDVLDRIHDTPELDTLKNSLLPDIKNNQSKYTVLNEQEEVEGHLCWAIEWPQMDKIWIDPRISGAIRKRIVHWSESGPIKSVIVNSDYREVQDGLFLPFRQEVTNFVGPEMELHQSLWRKDHSYFVYKVDSIQLGSFDAVAETFFDIKLPVGASVYDVRQDMHYTIWDPSVDPFAGPIEQGLKVNRYVMFRAICIIIGSILIFIAVWRMLRRMEG